MTKEEMIVSELRKRKQTLTTVESCTGGAISARIVDVPGASDVLKEAFVTYCDEAKHDLVGVSEESLREHTAVSRETAVEMAEGGRKTAGADLCLSATGIAGPGGTKEFPAGLVYIGCSYGTVTRVEEHRFQGSRNEVRMQAVDAALDLAVQMILG